MESDLVVQPPTSDKHAPPPASSGSLHKWFDWLRVAVDARRSGVEQVPKVQAEGAALHPGS